MNSLAASKLRKLVSQLDGKNPQDHS